MRVLVSRRRRPAGRCDPGRPEAVRLRRGLDAGRCFGRSGARHRALCRGGAGSGLAAPVRAGGAAPSAQPQCPGSGADPDRDGYGGRPHQGTGCRRGRLSGQAVRHGRAGGALACADTPRQRQGRNRCCKVAGVELDPAAHRVLYRNKPVELSAREFALLHALMLNAGRVLSRAQLEEQLYAWGEEVESNAVEVYIHHLRRKLFPELITTIRGVGYLIPADKSTTSDRK